MDIVKPDNCSQYSAMKMVSTLQPLTICNLPNVRSMPTALRTRRIGYHLLLTMLVLACNLLTGQEVKAQADNRMIRLAKIQVDPAQLQQYNTALKEQMQMAIRLEPGVLSYVAIADKKAPSYITILEIYADSAAYRSHIVTEHFKRYKATVQNMVRKLELVDMTMIGSAKKPDQ